MPHIECFDSDQIRRLSRALSESAASLADQWPLAQLEICRGNGVFRWFVSKEYGGFAWSNAQQIAAYIELAKGCLTTAFVLTQRTAAVVRIENSENVLLKQKLLPALASGELFSTVGISQLTTSRQHHQKPALQAVESPEGFILTGYSPWVTGGIHADWLVVGATLDDGRQLLAACKGDMPGVLVQPVQQLLALTGSHTGAVRFDNVTIPNDWLLVGPAINVISNGVGGRTGGLQTSALALGLAAAMLEFIEQQSTNRPDISRGFESLNSQWQSLHGQVMELAGGLEPCYTTNLFDGESLRRDANALALNCSHVALAAAKGAGYVADHPVARWCREALFFLVWSCPQKVIEANVCQFAGIQ